MNDVLRRLGWLLGTLWYYVFPIRRRVVLANLTRVFAANESVHGAIALSFYRKFCTNILELLFVRSILKKTNAITTEGAHYLTAAQARGKGVIAVTAHLGNFDLLACSQATSGVPLAIISKRLHFKFMNEIWMRIRRRCGLTIFLSHSASISVVRWLKKGRVLGLVVDQRLSQTNGGIPVPFFGYSVWTSPAAANLARCSGAALIPVMIHRRRDGGHHVVFGKEILASNENGCLDNVCIMERIHQNLEDWICRFPDEWMWLHRRFKYAVRPTPPVSANRDANIVSLKKTIA
ncbi:MAG: lysophospholipid acyltransferase family protein [Deltaproteobacteria bacterium]|nr:lysophospholipid acyltransferase family protein [Deltaproteobacteria bacterium]